MQLLDDAFLTRIEERPEDPTAYGDALRSVRVSETSPYLDIAAIAELHLDRGYVSPDAGDAAAAEPPAVTNFLSRYQQLHRALAGQSPSHLAIVAGDLLCERPKDDRAVERYRELVLPALQQIKRRAGHDLLVLPGNTDTYVADDGSSPFHVGVMTDLLGSDAARDVAGTPVATLIRVELEDGEGSAPLAYVAVIGFDSNAAGASGTDESDLGLISAAQLRAARRLVTTLRRGLGPTAPLYVLAATHHGLLPRGATSDPNESDATADADHVVAHSLTGMTANAAAVLTELQRMRVSLLLHADMQHRAITSLLRTPVDVGVRGSEIALVPLPSFDPDAQAAGMVRLRLNMWRGEAEVGYNFDRGLYGDDPAPLQTITPLRSASRVSAAERRLLRRVTSLVHQGGSARAREHLETTWNATGYVPLCLDGLSDARGTQLTPRSLRYYLLLLVREAPNGGYELLLSRHTPLRPSTVGDWDTLLLPAFTSVQDLLQRLRDDVLRQVVGKASDMDKADSAQKFERAVAALIEKGESEDGDLWADKLREVAHTELIKVSPTTGILTNYDYRLVVLLPFVADPAQVVASDEALRVERARERAIVSWLDELPRVARPGDPLSGPASIPMEAIMADGAGLRWEPAADPDDLALDENPAQSVELPPGAVWFPLPEADETTGPWRACPSIVARNADVMSWVERELNNRRTARGLLPPHLVMGGFEQASGFQAHGDPRPFSATEAGPDVEPAVSTTQAMRRVTFLAGYDLGDKLAYPDRVEIKRVILQRGEISVGAGLPARPVIEVFHADETWHPGTSLSELELGERLGVLRPVQRYVLKAGLERAREVNDFLETALSSDPWGFVRASLGGLSDPVSLTPPIIEQICPEDSDDADGGAHEFILCDGNHRVVERVWSDGEATRRMAAVAVVGTPEEPYYARAFSRYEWDVTAQNQLVVTPPTAFKHATRIVPDDVVEALAPAGFDPELLYRRYYRNLETGFGPMGGQGGRYA